MEDQGAALGPGRGAARELWSDLARVDGALTEIRDDLTTLFTDLSVLRIPDAGLPAGGTRLAPAAAMPLPASPLVEPGRDRTHRPKPPAAKGRKADRRGR